MTPVQKLASVEARYGDWKTLYMPVNVDMASPANLSFSGRMTMVRGESVHFSLRIFGMEVAALYMTADSVITLDKFHKYYIAESIASVLGDARLSINDVQDALLGRAFLKTGSPEDAPSLLARFALENTYIETDIVAAKSPWQGVEAVYILSPSAPGHLRGMAVQQAERQPVMVVYDAPAATPCGPVAYAASITATAASKAIALTINYKPDQAKWDEPRTPSVSVPASYKRIPASSLIKSLSAQ